MMFAKESGVSGYEESSMKGRIGMGFRPKNLGPK